MAACGRCFIQWQLEPASPSSAPDAEFVRGMLEAAQMAENVNVPSGFRKTYEYLTMIAAAIRARVGEASVPAPQPSPSKERE